MAKDKTTKSGDMASSLSISLNNSQQQQQLQQKNNNNNKHIKKIVMHEAAGNETVRVNTCFMNKYIKNITLFSVLNRFRLYICLLCK